MRSQKFEVGMLARSDNSALPTSGLRQKLLARHNWPGNIRELENVIERAVLLTPSALCAYSDAPVYCHVMSAGGILNDAVVLLP